MLKFWITTRPKPGMDIDTFDYEWGVLHTSLMVTTPSVLNGSFKRYVQHRSVYEGITDDEMVHPGSSEGWYSCADHLCATYDDVMHAVGAGDYKRRMFPHRFSDKVMVVELTGTEVLHDVTPTRLDAGGVKIINHIRRRDGVSQGEFAEWWRTEYAPLVLDHAVGHGPVRRYVQNPSVEMDASFFAGTLFELGNTGTYAGVEELYVDDLDAARALRVDPAVYEPLRAKAADMIDADRCFGMVMVERVVFDFTSDRAEQGPAVRDPSSIEYQMLQSERAAGRWNEIRPVGSPKVAGE